MNTNEASEAGGFGLIAGIASKLLTGAGSSDDSPPQYDSQSAQFLDGVTPTQKWIAYLIVNGGGLRGLGTFCVSFSIALTLLGVTIKILLSG